MKLHCVGHKDKLHTKSKKSLKVPPELTVIAPEKANQVWSFTLQFYRTEHKCSFFLSNSLEGKVS